MVSREAVVARYGGSMLERLRQAWREYYNGAKAYRAHQRALKSEREEGL